MPKLLLALLLAAAPSIMAAPSTAAVAKASQCLVNNQITLQIMRFPLFVRHEEKNYLTN